MSSELESEYQVLTEHLYAEEIRWDGCQEGMEDYQRPKIGAYALQPYAPWWKTPVRHYHSSGRRVPASLRAGEPQLLAALKMSLPMTLP